MIRLQQGLALLRAIKCLHAENRPLNYYLEKARKRHVAELVKKLDYDHGFVESGLSSETMVHKEMFRRFSRFCLFLFCGASLLVLSSCGGGIDGTKDLFGAIGFKSGADPIIAPGDAACGAGAGSSASSSGLPSGRCLSAAEAANAIAQQCADCKVVLTFKGTNESTFCGSIALTTSKLLYGVGSGASVITAQEAAMAACKAAEGATNPSTCALVKTRCL